MTDDNNVITMRSIKGGKEVEVKKSDLTDAPPVPNQALVELLTTQLEEAKAGRLQSLAYVTFTDKWISDYGWNTGPVPAELLFTWVCALRKYLLEMIVDECDDHEHTPECEQ